MFRPDTGAAAKTKQLFTICFLDPATSSSDQTWLEWLTQLNVTQVPTTLALNGLNPALWLGEKKKRYYSVPACAGFVDPCSFPWGLQQQSMLRVVEGFDDSQKPPEATLVVQFFKGGQLTPDDMLGRVAQQHSALCRRSCHTRWWSRLSARSTLWLEWIWLYHLKFITPPVSSKLEQKQSHKDLFVTALSPPQE